MFAVKKGRAEGRSMINVSLLIGEEKDLGREMKNSHPSSVEKE